MMRPLLLAALLLLAACGTERDTQTKTVERVETTTGPLVADIPMVGQVVYNRLSIILVNDLKV